MQTAKKTSSHILNHT